MSLRVLISAESICVDHNGSENFAMEQKKHWLPKGIQAKLVMQIVCPFWYCAMKPGKSFQFKLTKIVADGIN
jgi:hypothetical protein